MNVVLKTVKPAVKVMLLKTTTTNHSVKTINQDKDVNVDKTIANLVTQKPVEKLKKNVEVPVKVTGVKLIKTTMMKRNQPLKPVPKRNQLKNQLDQPQSPLMNTWHHSVYLKLLKIFAKPTMVKILLKVLFDLIKSIRKISPLSNQLKERITKNISQLRI